MNRNIVYPGAIPLDTDILTIQRNIMSALGFLAQATLGSATVVDGLACTQQAVPNMTVNIAPGSIIALSTVDASSFGSLASDNTDPLVKMGINPSIVISSTLGTIVAPGTTGQSINYLIEATFQEADGTSVILPYYNSANPAVPYSGPANAGTPQNTQRLQTVNLAIKAGTPATTGTQTTPSPDANYVGLWVITVAFAQTSIVSGNISQYSSAPFIGPKVPAIPLSSQTSGPISSVSNLKMSISAASASATMTADEIVVGTSLGGSAYRLASFNKTVNLATTGAGGMDTGTAPVSGYVALYAIYNPSTQTSALLATNATSAVAPTIYGGANMPSGYTSSGLISVWPTNGSSQFVVGFQIGRAISIASATALSTTSQTTIISLSISSIVPPNAKRVSGVLSAVSTAPSAGTAAVYATSGSLGTVALGFGVASNEGTSTSYSVALGVTQTIYYSMVSSAGTPSFMIFICAYEI